MLRGCVGRSGNHEEFQRANGEADEDAEGSESGAGGGGKSKKGPKRVFRYSFMLPEDNNVSVPMFVIAYQELYNQALTEVTAVRIWKFIFHEHHSDSELWRKLMDENNSTYMSAGVAHTQVAQRKTNVMREHKHNRALCCQTNLEYFAGTQYLRVINEQTYLEVLKQAGGRTIHNAGRPAIDVTQLPPGVLNSRIKVDNEGLGGIHPLAPEYVHNAKRREALSANLMDIDTDEPLDVHPDYLNPSKFFDANGNFRCCAPDLTTGGFFFNIDPSCTNIFDCALPRPIHGIVCAGPEVLRLFKDVKVKEMHPQWREGGPGASLSELFDSFLNEVDPTIAAMERSMAETDYAFDSYEMDDAQRRALNSKKWKHYGETEDNQYVFAPKQSDRDVQAKTQRIFTLVVERWLTERRGLHNEINERLRVGPGASEDMLTCPLSDPRMADLRKEMEETQTRHHNVMREMFEMHANLFTAIFQSKRERDNMPSGYNAMWDGLMKELDKTPNHTASVAFAYDTELMADDISAFAHTHLWIGEFFEKGERLHTLPRPCTATDRRLCVVADCFIEGREHLCP